MEKLLLIALGVSLIKVVAFFITVKIKTAPSKTLAAEEVIKCRHKNPILYKEELKNTIIDYSRDKETEEKYKEVREMFKFKLQNKEISRGEILGIENYLRELLKDKRKYKNNAHAIYSMLKNPNITYLHMGKIKNFLQQ